MTTSLPPNKQRWLAGLTLLFGLATLVLGFIGLGRVEGWPHDLETFSDLLFKDAAMLFLQQPSLAPEQQSILEQDTVFAFARLAALAFASMAVATILLSLSRPLQAWLGRCWIGMWSYLRPKQGHALVIGLGRIGMQLVKDIRAKEGGRRSVIVLDVDDTNPKLDEARRLGALVLTGDATERAFRKRSRLHLAREVFITCGDDAINIDIASHVCSDLHKKGPSKLQCYVHTGDPEYTVLCRTCGLIPENTDAVNFHIFNIHEHAARRDLMLHPEHGLIYQVAPGEEEVTHYFVFGFGAMGQTTAVQLGRLAHFKNHRRLRLTILDEFGEDNLPGTMQKAKQCFLDRYSGFCPADGTLDLADHARSTQENRDAWSYRGYRPAHPAWRFDDRKAAQEEAVEYVVNAEFLNMPTDPEAPALLQALLRRVALRLNPPVKAAFLFCFDDDRRNVCAALHLQKALLREAPAALRIPLYLYLPNEEGFANLVSAKNSKQTTNNGKAAQRDPKDRFPLFVFGQRTRNAGYQEVVKPDIKELAAAFYEAWFGKNAPSYEESTSLDKFSSEEAAIHAQVKLQAVGKKYRVSSALSQDIVGNGFL